MSSTPPPIRKGDKVNSGMSIYNHLHESPSDTSSPGEHPPDPVSCTKRLNVTQNCDEESSTEDCIEYYACNKCNHPLFDGQYKTPAPQNEPFPEFSKPRSGAVSSDARYDSVSCCKCRERVGWGSLRLKYKPNGCDYARYHIFAGAVHFRRTDRDGARLRDGEGIIAGWLQKKAIRRSKVEDEEVVPEVEEVPVDRGSTKEPYVIEEGLCSPGALFDFSSNRSHLSERPNITPNAASSRKRRSPGPPNSSPVGVTSIEQSETSVPSRPRQQSATSNIGEVRSASNTNNTSPSPLGAPPVPPIRSQRPFSSSLNNMAETLTSSAGDTRLSPIHPIPSEQPSSSDLRKMKSRNSLRDLKSMMSGVFGGGKSLTNTIAISSSTGAPEPTQESPPTNSYPTHGFPGDQAYTSSQTGSQPAPTHKDPSLLRRAFTRQ